MCAFQMKVDNLTYKTIPQGMYDLKLVSFKPKWNKNKDGVNFNAVMEVVNHPEYDGTKIFETLSTKAGFMQAEFCHAFGLPMEDLGNGDYTLPGIWDGKAESFKEDDPTTWVYEGPLLGRIAKCEVGIKTYEGKDSNAVRQYLCALSDADCAAQYGKDKHVKDLLAKK